MAFTPEQLNRAGQIQVEHYMRYWEALRNRPQWSDYQTLKPVAHKACDTDDTLRRNNVGLYLLTALALAIISLPIAIIFG